MLGMARRAGALLIGQDKVLPALRKREKYALFISEDCSADVFRRAVAAEKRDEAEIFLLEGVSRALLGASLGIASAQIAALPAESGFVKKIHTLICERRDADE